MARTNLTNEMVRVYKKLNRPWKVQDFLNDIKINFEEDGDTHYSPKKVLEFGKAQCMEGAGLAASIFRFHGGKPFVLDLRTKVGDVDHVVAVYEWGGFFGAISKTNHGVLRYRDPIYKNMRELALSYFHEYFLDTGEKTLREYSDLFDLSRFDDLYWETTDEYLWQIPQELDESKHFSLFDDRHAKSLRPADELEVFVGKFTEWQLLGKKTVRAKLKKTTLPKKTSLVS